MSSHETATLSADLVLFNEDDEVLLVRRANEPHFGAWALPGGRVDVGETFHAAAVREAREETGLDLAGVKLFEVGTYGDPGRDPRRRVVSVAYTARLSGAVPRAGSDAAELRWIDHDDALNGGLAFDHARILADALELLYDGRLNTPRPTVLFQNNISGDVGQHIQAHTINNLELR